MATTCLVNSWRRDVMKGTFNHDTGGDTHNIALYNGSGHNKQTSAYSSTNEVSSSGTNYTTGGKALTGQTVTLDGTNGVAYLDFDDVSWPSSTITATDCLIYMPDIAGDPALYVGDFGGSRSSYGGSFQIIMPQAAYNSAIVRLA